MQEENKKQVSEEENEEYLKIEDSDYQAPNEVPKSGIKVKLESFLESRLFIALIIFLIGISSFTLGRLSKIDEVREPVRIEYKQKTIGSQTVPKDNIQNTASVIKSQQDLISQTTGNVGGGGQVVGSKNSTKYHYPWCSGAKRISPKNLITFNSIEEARKAGYVPAANCKGLK